MCSLPVHEWDVHTARTICRSVACVFIQRYLLCFVLLLAVYLAMHNITYTILRRKNMPFSCPKKMIVNDRRYLRVLFFFFKSSGGWVKIKLKLPQFHVSDTCVPI